MDLPTVEKTISHSTYSELAELRARAQRAIDETIVLIGDFRFLRAWWRMRPSDVVTPSPMLDE